MFLLHNITRDIAGLSLKQDLLLDFNNVRTCGVKWEKTGFFPIKDKEAASLRQYAMPTSIFSSEVVEVDAEVTLLKHRRK